MAPKSFFALELRDTRERSKQQPNLVTFFYQNAFDGFTTKPEKAMRFETATDAYSFLNSHKLFGFVVIEVKGEEFFDTLDRLDALITGGESPCAT